MPLVIGLMSGTSADGVDAALVQIEGSARSTRIRLHAFHTFAFPAGMREAILAASDPRTGTVHLLCRLNVALGEVFAEAALDLARKAGISIGAVDLIGSHGQTVQHLPEPSPLSGHAIRSTLQLGEPSVIAERTGVMTVADFRPRDMAAGGEGAPLAPYAHYVLFGDAHRTRIVHNIGGISNVTVLPGGGGLAAVLAFDTGPGNMPIDGAIGRMTGGQEAFDKDGVRASCGRVHQPLVDELLAHPFLRRPPPKSTGREAFGALFLDDVFVRGAELDVTGDDLIATLTAFTTATIVDAYQRFILPWYPTIESILCGGGSRNPTLRTWLRRELPEVEWLMCDDFGISADALEAVSFAVLAHETVCGHAANVPTATGAKRHVILGKVVPGRDGWRRFQKRRREPENSQC
ncbi:MAG: anhydro-N-acetylmuramic acid kinase [Candidatus Tectomicrobia bacterium]|nr:anhydro-N-acetylmuramic acid kinase [Candidatus Tectomicrobia bacterium]